MTDVHPAPLISVIIPAFNVGPFIGEALASVQAQTLARFEAIVIDDGSTDDTAERVGPYLADARFRCIRTINHGLCAARNRGLAEARAPYAALLDGDDRYRPDYLAAMLARIERVPHADFVTCDARSFRTDGGGGELFSDRYPQGEPITLARVLQQEVTVFGLCTMRVAGALAVGGYDEALTSAEDLDLWLRMLIAGHVGGLVAKPLVEYRRRPGSLSDDVVGINLSRAQVFDKTARAIQGRPEAALAAAARDLALSVAAFETGVDSALAGEVRAGIGQMRSSRLKAGNGKWRLALGLISLLPPLAQPLLAMYRRGNQFA